MILAPHSSDGFSSPLHPHYCCVKIPHSLPHLLSAHHGYVNASSLSLVGKKLTWVFCTSNIHIHGRQHNWYVVQTVSYTTADVIIESLSNPHHDLPNDTEIVAQLVIDHCIFLQTVPVKKNTSQQSWKLKVGCKMWVAAIINYLSWFLIKDSCYPSQTYPCPHFFNRSYLCKCNWSYLPDWYGGNK